MESRNLEHQGFVARKNRHLMHRWRFLKLGYSNVRSVGERWGCHIHATTFAVEFDFAIDEGENRVIATDADVTTGMELCSALADDDVPGNHGLAAEFFHAEALAARVASVFDGALSFLMGHGGELVED